MADNDNDPPKAVPNKLAWKGSSDPAARRKARLAGLRVGTWVELALRAAAEEEIREAAQQKPPKPSVES